MCKHEYLMEVEEYFGGGLRFQVVAANREEAIVKAKEYLRSKPGKDNRRDNTLRVVKKLKPKKDSSH